MIRAVFFDLYNTLARFYPPREQVQAQAAEALGLRLEREGLVRGYMAADEFMTAQNAQRHVARLSVDEQRAFFTRYEQLVLKGAGVDATEELAASMWDRVRGIPYGLALYNDALPCLKALKAEGFILGIISNLNGDLDELSRTLGMADSLDFTVSSFAAGAEKPHPRIFQVALGKADVQPSEAVHVGDQYNGDVVGARGAGLHPVLLDRESVLAHYTDVTRIAGLDQVRPLVHLLSGL